MEREIKLRPDIVDELKRANSNYPLATKDFDGKFLKTLLKAVFKKSELRKCASKSSLRALNATKLKFTKGILYADWQI